MMIPALRYVEQATTVGCMSESEMHACMSESEMHACMALPLMHPTQLRVPAWPLTE